MPKGVYKRTEFHLQCIRKGVKKRRSYEKDGNPQYNKEGYWLGKKNLVQSELMKKNNPMKWKMQRERMRKYNPMYNEAVIVKFRGKNNPNWQGGISFEPYSLEFNKKLREQIRERDEYICQFCGIEENGRKHNIHHINYNKEDCSFLNLITICVGCNAKANFSRDKWQLFFEVLQEIRY